VERLTWKSAAISGSTPAIMNSVVFIKNVPRVSKKTTSGSLPEFDVGADTVNDPSVEAWRLDVQGAGPGKVRDHARPGFTDLLVGQFKGTSAHTFAGDRVNRGD